MISPQLQYLFGNTAIPNNKIKEYHKLLNKMY